MDAGNLDHRARLAAFSFLDEQTRVHGKVVPYKVLLDGFTFDGRRVPLLGPQGIFKPAVLPDMSLSITTTTSEVRAHAPQHRCDRGVGPSVRKGQAPCQCHA